MKYQTAVELFAKDFIILYSRSEPLMFIDNYFAMVNNFSRHYLKNEAVHKYFASLKNKKDKTQEHIEKDPEFSTLQTELQHIDSVHVKDSESVVTSLITKNNRPYPYVTENGKETTCPEYVATLQPYFFQYSFFKEMMTVCEIDSTEFAEDLFNCKIPVANLK